MTGSQDMAGFLAQMRAERDEEALRRLFDMAASRRRMQARDRRDRIILVLLFVVPTLALAFHAFFA